MRAAVTAGGYEAVTIEGLAADAEVSKQTIYRWWPSKAAILGEALLEGSFPAQMLTCRTRTISKLICAGGSRLCRLGWRMRRAWRSPEL